MKRIKLLLATTLTMVVLNGFVYGQDTTLTITNGNVGIGTTNPVATLHVESASGGRPPQIQMHQTSEGGFTVLRFENSSDQFWDIAESPGDQLRFFTGSASFDVMTLTSSGRVGIGTINPGSRLDVIADGATKIDLRTTSTTAAVFQRFFHSTNIQGGAIGFDTDDNVLKLVHGGNFDSSTKGLAIASDGNVGIGTTTPSEKFTVSGTIESTTGGFKFPDGTVQNTAAGNGGFTHVSAVGTEKLANATGTGEATIVVAVNSSNGPVTGLNQSDFKLSTHTVPPGGCLVSLVDITELQDGAYSLNVVPFTGNPDCKWLKGRYTISILVTTPQGQAVGVAAILVDVE